MSLQLQIIDPAHLELAAEELRALLAQLGLGELEVGPDVLRAIASA